MPTAIIRSAAVCLLTLLAAFPAAAGQDDSRSAVIAALERLIVTGEPRHTDHDAGQELQLAVDAAIARGDAEIEKLAVRAATPLLASISRPVNRADDLPSLSFSSSNVLRVSRARPYRARMFASVDGSEFTAVGVVESGKGQGGRIDTILPQLASRPGFHVVRLRAEMEFGASSSSWTENRTLQPLYYVVYEPGSDASAAVRALIYAPAATPAKELDPRLGDEPFAAWLSGLLSDRRGERDFMPEWYSDYCEERTDEPAVRVLPGGICSVVGFQVRGEIGHLWFRTADIRETERGMEWVPVSPPHFEGMTLSHAPQPGNLSSLPSLLETTAESRPAGDISILPDDIAAIPAAPKPGSPVDITISVRNIGQQDLHKAVVMVASGTDLQGRPDSRSFVVDVPAQSTRQVKLQINLSAGYGFVMAQGMQLGEHSPAGTWTPDPTPDDACAFRIINAQLAPPRYKETLLEMAGGGCTAK